MATQQSIKARMEMIEDGLTHDLDPLDRIKLLCEKGIILKNTTDMARSLREIAEIVDTL